MKIITDTGTMLSKERADALDVTLIPLQVELKGKNYRDYFDISAKDFIAAVQDGIPNSSQPAIGAVMEAFNDVKDGLYIAMTSGLSSTYVSAAGIKAESNYDNIFVFNSRTLAGTQAYLVELAAKYAKTLTLNPMLEKLEKSLSSCKSYLIPTDFNYLKRNGRLSPVAALMSGLLKIKPIVFHIPGMEKLEKFGVARTWIQAVDSIIEDMNKANVSEKYKVYVSHGDNLEIANLFKERIQAFFANLDIDVLLLSPVMMTQGGPGCVAVQYILKEEE